ncbi:hypothetical protein [Victivallis vadensis]|uniref:hypothetical protein n=1 Tax=Victivallis vadensis TaxID=172901 RepID=UPI00266CE944|nr:hypothetical protein [Victivallis vadensis]
MIDRHSPPIIVKQRQIEPRLRSPGPPVSRNHLLNRPTLFFKQHAVIEESIPVAEFAAAPIQLQSARDIVFTTFVIGKHTSKIEHCSLMPLLRRPLIPETFCDMVSGNISGLFLSQLPRQLKLRFSLTGFSTFPKLLELILFIRHFRFLLIQHTISRKLFQAILPVFPLKDGV